MLLIEKKIMVTGCAIFKSIKNEDVIIIRVPSKIDLLAVAPTNPTIISIADIGAACNSNMVPLNFGKNVLKDPFETLCVSNLAQESWYYKHAIRYSINFLYPRTYSRSKNYKI